MFNVSICEYFSVLNVSIVCIRNTARSKSIPLLCTHVDSYKFSTVHPSRIGWLGCCKKHVLELHQDFGVYTRPLIFTIAPCTLVCWHCVACEVFTRPVCMKVTQLRNGRELRPSLKCIANPEPYSIQHIYQIRCNMYR